MTPPFQKLSSSAFFRQPISSDRAAAAFGQVPSHGPAKGYLLITGGATELSV